jgi:hypothetical protein
LADLRLQWFWTLFLGFAAGALGVVQSGTRPAAYFVECSPEFFREAANAAGIRWDLSEVDAELKNSPEWEKFESILRVAIYGPIYRATPAEARSKQPVLAASSVTEIPAPAATGAAPSLLSPGEPPADDPDTRVESFAAPKDASQAGFQTGEAASATAATESATGPPATEPLSFGKWLLAQMDPHEITAYRIQKVGGPKQPTTKRALADLSGWPSTKRKLVKALNEVRRSLGLPPVQPPKKLL